MKATQIVWTERLTAFDKNSTFIDLAKLRQYFWFNPTNVHSMRLSYTGFQFASVTAKIAHYSHTLGEKILPKTLLQLERSLQYPYYIVDLSHLKVFDEATSTTLILYNNELQTYLNNIEKFNT
jgi:hypothetical protein